MRDSDVFLIVMSVCVAAAYLGIIGEVISLAR